MNIKIDENTNEIKDINMDIDKNKKLIKVNDFEFYLVMDGYYRLDGGAMYGMVPKTIWEKVQPHDEFNRLYMAMNCLLVKKGDRIYLADAGIGDKLDQKGREIFGIEREKSLIEEMKDIGVTPHMVTHVIPTHLHFDHTGWMVDNNENIMFPNAKYYIQKEEWEEAMNPHVRFKDSYLKPYFQALKDSPHLVLLEGDSVIDEILTILYVPGHSKGHQVPLFDAGEIKFAHMGDVVALATQVRENWTCGFDREPETTMTNKKPLMDRAYREGWLIMSAHDRTVRIGTLETVKGKYRLKKII